MRLSKYQKKYEPLLIPVEKPLSKLSRAEAKVYFNWYVDHIDERSEYIRHKVSSDLKISIELLDFSVESLVFIWRWFLKVAEIKRTPKSVLGKIREELKRNGESEEFTSDIISYNGMELSVFTRYVIRDIGMYVGKMFVTNYPTLRWDYHTTKKDSFTNIPQIFGFVNTTYDPPFEERFDPIFYTEMIASNLLDKTQSENDLYNLCVNWIQHVPKSD